MHIACLMSAVPVIRLARFIHNSDEDKKTLNRQTAPAARTVGTESHQRTSKEREDRGPVSQNEEIKGSSWTDEHRLLLHSVRLTVDTLDMDNEIQRS